LLFLKIENSVLTELEVLLFSSNRSLTCFQVLPDLSSKISVSGSDFVISIAECLVPPYRLGQAQLQQEFINVIVGGDNIIFEPIVDENIAIQAAQIRARYNLQLPDAFQVAVAMAAECEALLTNDATFRRVTELRVLVLDDLKTGE
jgi:predicted nucleic acid-binding protein